MDGKKSSARSKSRTSKKDEVAESSISEEEKQFVENRKKKAIVKAHGIDNVKFRVNKVLDIYF